MAFTSFRALLPDRLKEKLGIRPKKAAPGPPQSPSSVTSKQPLATFIADSTLIFKTTILSPIMQTEVRKTPSDKVRRRLSTDR